MPLTPGTKLGPYEIVAPLGAGGMGEVYRAKDTRLGREVAIKGLPEAFAQHPERLARFDREARLLASLSHPNVAAIYGLEEAEGTPYLVLELVEGETLAARLARGPLTVREALDVCSQVAAAVEAAHERGIVHRDLKPGNVMITPSRAVKVLDFGLAKGGATEASAPGDLSASPTMALSATGAGVLLGTAAYMSPEQARGQAVDRRADVWAFGCVLFECLSGRQVFAGETVSDVIARILEREPDWNALPPATPVRLRDLVRRCLTKDGGERPRDIGDLRRELGAIAMELSSPSGGRAVAGDAERPSLAVLYFENLANDPDSEYFCAGITEDILTDLSKIKGLRVASRNAVVRYRGAPVDLQKVGADLGVGAVLEGSVRRAGGRVRISAQLVNVVDGFHVWAERYDRTMEDVFAVQEEIASSIAEALRVALSPAEAKALVKNRPADVKAYDLYLRGRQLYGQYSEESLRAALALFRQATEVDPGYALAWAGTGDCLGQLGGWGHEADAVASARLGLEAARRALAIDPRLPDAHKAEALNLLYLGDLEGSRAALQRAVEVDPRFTPALNNLCVDCFIRADVAGAERHARRVLDIDPQDGFACTWLSFIQMLTRRPEDCMEVAGRIRQISSETFYVSASHGLRMVAQIMKGDLVAAARTVQEALADGAREPDMRMNQTLLLAIEGRVEEARKWLAELESVPGINTGALVLGATAALRVGLPEIAMSLISRQLVENEAPTLLRLYPELHPLLDRAPFAPRVADRALVWPLEAPMLEASVHRLFREVRIESALPQGSAIR